MGKSNCAVCSMASGRNALSSKSGEAVETGSGNWLDTGGGRQAHAADTAGEHHGKFPRFTPRLEMYVFHHGVGRVLEISMGGVSFSYIADTPPPEELPTEGILFTHSGRHVSEIPFEIMGDEVYSRFFSSEYFVRQRQVRFGELSEAQIRQLENFLLNNAHIPQCSYDTRYAEYKTVYAPPRQPVVDRQPRPMEAGTDVRMD